MSPLQQFLASSFATIAMLVQPAAPCPPRGLTVDADVINIVDGDTLDVRISYDLRVRLLDCWAPETRTLDLNEKVRGLQSKAHMHTLIDARRVRVHLPSTGRFTDLVAFDRVLGHVWRLRDGKPEDQNISVMMVEAGFAKAEKPPRNRGVQ